MSTPEELVQINTDHQLTACDWMGQNYVLSGVC
jgi:hypothetical protein